MYFHFSLLSFTHCNANFIAYKNDSNIDLKKLKLINQFHILKCIELEIYTANFN